MTLELWTRTSGTWINVVTVLVGTGLGLLLKQRLPEAMQQIITQSVGLLTLWLGFTMAGSLGDVAAGPIDGVLLGLLALILGGLLGEWWRLEQRLNQLGDWLKQRFRGRGRFTEGFAAASLLFCIGPMTIVGSLNNGLTGDNQLLVLKAIMDGLIAIPFASSYGIGVGFSALPIAVIQGGLSLLAGTLAGAIADPASDPRVLLTTGVGGFLILGIGMGLLEIAKIRLASFLPAIALAPLLYAIAVHLF
ncbi:MAG: DUF554 domain-containing protein [Spirulinaceae cyanobacterium SM2_1_0]|nr:DUF554 domain-containing protein [Spirulinaceae cyanobacterium SM2_1_0]